MTTPQPGTHIKQYEIVEQIGVGGMATVYRAHHARLARDVAIKMMHSMFLTDRSFVSRFEREAQVVAQLDHPNIVPVYDYDLYEGQPYLVMKLIEGRTLKDILGDGALPLGDILRVMPAIAHALTYAHSKGVLHRDIKPSNIIIDQANTPYLTDFGLARIAKAGESTMSADMLLGTPFYISPEQAQGSVEVDTRADVYSLGVVLYELVVGRLPFIGDTPYIIVHKHIYEQPTPPSLINAEIPPQIEHVLLQALAKDPAARYATPTALVDAFAEAVSASGLVQLDSSRIESGKAYRPPPVAVSIPAAYSANSGNSGDSSGAVDGVGNFGALFTQDAFREMGKRIRDAVADIYEQVNDGENFKNLRAEAEKAMVEIKQAVDDSDDVHINFGGDTSARRRVIERDWGTSEASIRYRIKERMSPWSDLTVHALIYVIVIGLLMIVVPNMLHVVLEEASKSPGSLDPLLNIDPTLIVALMWGSGLACHAVDTFYKTGARLERRRAALNEAMTLRYGEQWQTVANDREYKRVRKDIKKRFEVIPNLLEHFFIAAALTATVIFTWDPLSQLIVAQETTDVELMEKLVSLPIPLIFALVMLFSLVVHVGTIVFNMFFGTGAEERALKQELERVQGYKAKNDAQYHGDTLTESLIVEAKPKQAPAGVRLTGDGEFTDSFVQELQNDAQSRSKQ